MHSESSTRGKGLSLTHNEKVMLHLLNYAKYNDSQGEVPPEMSQQGIADTMGVNIGIVSRSLGELKGNGLLEERLCHIKGVKKRRRAYFLTGMGYQSANKLYEDVSNQVIEFIDASAHSSMVEIKDIKSYLDTKCSFIRILLSITDGVFDVRKLTDGIDSPPVSIVPQIKLVAREREFEQLKKLFLQTKDGTGNMIFISGEAGIGKTRLVSELCQLYSGEYEIITSHCLFQTEEEPYQPFTTIMQRCNDLLQDISLVDASDDEIVAMALSHIGMKLMQSPEEQEDTSNDTQFNGDEIDFDTLFVKPTDVNQEHNKLFMTIWETLKEVVRMKPTILLIEDLHWADKYSLELLHHLGSKISGEKLLICCTLRSESLGTSPHGEYVNLLKEEIGTFEITLERLAIKGTEALIKQHLGSDQISDELLDYIHTETEGVPLFIEETIKYLQEEGQISGGEIDLGRIVRPSVPEKVQNIIMKRIGKQKKEENALLEFASSMGRIFDFDVVQKSLCINDNELLDSIDALTAQHLISEELIDGELVGIFHHSKIQEVIYNSLGPKYREIIHSKIAASIEEISRDENNDFINVLAYHFTRAGNPEKTYTYSILAGDQAFQIYSLGEAHIHYVNALKFIDKANRAEEKVNLLLKIGKVMEITGNWDSAGEYYNDAHAIAIDTKKAEVYARQANLFIKQGKYEEAIEHSEAALGTSIDGTRERALALNTLGIAYFNKGESKEALKCCQSSLEIFEKHDDKRNVARLYNEIGMINRSFGNNELALEYYLKSLEIKEILKDKLELSKSYGNLGVLYQFMGKYEKSVEFYTRSLNMSEEMDDIHGIARTLNNLGGVYYLKGEYNKALSNYEKSLSFNERMGNIRGISNIYLNIGLIYFMKSDYSEARAHYEKCLREYKKLGDQRGHAQCLRCLGLVNQREGNLDSAISMCEEAKEISENIGHKESVAWSQYALGLSHYCKGNIALSLRLYEDSLKSFEEMGNQHAIALVYTSLGEIYLTDNSELALNYFTKGAEISESIGDREILSSSKCGLSILYAMMGDFAAAEKEIDMALNIADEMGSKEMIYLGTMGSGRVQAMNKNWKKSSEAFEKSIAGFDEIGYKFYIGKAQYEYAMMWEAKGDSKMSVHYVALASKIFEEMNAKYELLKTNEIRKT